MFISNEIVITALICIEENISSLGFEELFDNFTYFPQQQQHFEVTCVRYQLSSSQLYLSLVFFI
jgi:hypothetical protein